jgi:hypothetical protein
MHRDTPEQALAALEWFAKEALDAANHPDSSCGGCPAFVYAD